MRSKKWNTTSIIALVWAFILVSPADSAIDADGLCSLFAFAPFTYNGEAATPFSGGDPSQTNTGFSHLAAALLAAQHFNARDASVVPELKNFENCSIRFDLEHSKAFDTGSVGHMASRGLFREGRVPCAGVGAANEMPNLELSALATAAEFPLIIHRGYDIKLSDPIFSPYSNLMFPSLPEFATALAQFLVHTGRTDFISFVYALSDTGAQRREAVSYLLDGLEMTWRSNSYFVPTDQDDQRSVFSALRQVKESGYRTIVVSMNDAVTELPLIAQAAEELGLNNGEYVWIWFVVFEPILFTVEDPVVRKLLAGSAFFMPMEGWWFSDPEKNAFLQAWDNVDADFIARVNAANPIPPGEPGYVYAGPNYFTDVDLEFGSGFIYDAVMAHGMGACLAEQVVGLPLSSNAHLAGIRATNFTGSTGSVRFGTHWLSASRAEWTTAWGAFSLLPPVPGTKGEDYTLTDIIEPGKQKWKKVAPFVYPDGGTEPPPKLRDTPEQNYLDPTLRGIGLGLMSFAILLAIISMVWVYLHRTTRIVRASQPEFVYILLLGAIVSASSILPMSFDESYGWSTKALGRACMASTWLFPLGHILTYTSLFCKLWRINKVLQFARRKIEIRQVAWPLGALILGALIVLSLWTGLSPVTWERKEIDEDTGESIGVCSCDSTAAFVIPLVILTFIPTLLCGYMAYKTKDIDESYSESKWIFVLFLVQIEVILVSVPLVIILSDISTNGRYMGNVLQTWIFPMSTILCIMLPKVLAHYSNGNSTPSRRATVAQGGTRISGVNIKVPATGSHTNIGSTKFSTTSVGNRTDGHELHNTSDAQPVTSNGPTEEVAPQHSTITSTNAVVAPAAAGATKESSQSDPVESDRAKDVPSNDGANDEAADNDDDGATNGDAAPADSSGGGATETENHVQTSNGANDETTDNGDGDEGAGGATNGDAALTDTSNGANETEKHAHTSNKFTGAERFM